MEDEEREGEAPLDALARNAVNIMTVHAAKGLEFPIVVVPDMGTGFRERFGQIMIGDDTRLVGIRVPNPKDDYKPADTPVLTALREMQREKERAEKKRLLYVALTRARDHLIMCGTLQEDLAVPAAFAKIADRVGHLSTRDNPGRNRTGEKRLDSGNGTSFNFAILSKPEQIPAEVAGKDSPGGSNFRRNSKERAGTGQSRHRSGGRQKMMTVSGFEKREAGREVTVPGGPRVQVSPGKFRGIGRGQSSTKCCGRDAATILERVWRIFGRSCSAMQRDTGTVLRPIS